MRVVLAQRLSPTLSVGLALNCLLYVATALKYALALGVVINLTTLVLGQPAARIRFVTGAFLSAVILFSQLRFAEELLLSDRSSAANHAQVRAAVASVDPAKPRAVDAFAARFIYDYRLPAGTQSWEYLFFPYKSLDSFEQRSPGSVWLIQTEGPLPSKLDPVRILGHATNNLPRRPDDITLIQ